MIEKIIIKFWLDRNNIVNLDINTKYIVHVLSDDIIYTKGIRYCHCRLNQYTDHKIKYLVELSKHDWFSQLSIEDKRKAIWEMHE